MVINTYDAKAKKLSGYREKMDKRDVVIKCKNNIHPFIPGSGDLKVHKCPCGEFDLKVLLKSAINPGKTGPVATDKK